MFYLEIGIVPRFCEEIFQTIEHRKGDQTTVEVTFSMLEIYNEIVRDLLNVVTDNKNKKKGLKVREHPTKGFYGKSKCCSNDTLLTRGS